MTIGFDRGLSISSNAFKTDSVSCMHGAYAFPDLRAAVFRLFSFASR